MAVSRKVSQPRNVRFSTNFPELPSGLPADVAAQLRDWYDDLIGAMKDDHQTIEDAFAALRAELGTQDETVLKRIADLEARLAASEGQSNHWPLIFDFNVAEDAGIKESKLALNFPTHSSANDPTAGQKQALTGTAGSPSLSNRYVTETDPRFALIGESNTLEKEFPIPSQTWTWEHNLGFRPIVEVFNSNRELLVAYVDNSNHNILNVLHTYNETGFIVINK